MLGIYNLLDINTSIVLSYFVVTWPRKIKTSHTASSITSSKEAAFQMTSMGLRTGPAPWRARIKFIIDASDKTTTPDQSTINCTRLSKLVFPHAQRAPRIWNLSGRQAKQLVEIGKIAAGPGRRLCGVTIYSVQVVQIDMHICSAYLQRSSIL